MADGRDPEEFADQDGEEWPGHRHSGRRTRGLTFWTRILPAREWCRLAALGVAGALGALGILLVVVILNAGGGALALLGVGIGLAGFALFVGAVFPIDGLQPERVVGEILSRATGVFLVCVGAIVPLHTLITFEPKHSAFDSLWALFPMVFLILIPLGIMLIVGSYRSWSNW